MSAVPPPAPPPADGWFTNEPVDVAGLPRLDEDHFVPLDRRHRLSGLAAAALTAVVVAIVGAVVASITTRPAVPLAIAGGIIALVAVGAVLWLLEFRRLGYLLRDHDVSYRSGLLTHQVATVPFGRVQHVRVDRGPIERLLGLATISVNSAGPDITIPGLRVDDAERVKQLITERAGVDEPTIDAPS